LNDSYDEVRDRPGRNSSFVKAVDQSKDLDLHNKALFLQQELEAAKQENKFLKDTLALKNQQKYGGISPVDSQGRDVIELENALQEATQTIEELRNKLTNEEARQVV
jgi:hypothetical protein